MIDIYRELVLNGVFDWVRRLQIGDADLQLEDFLSNKDTAGFVYYELTRLVGT